MFLAGNADWISEFPFLIRHNNNTIHSSIKITPIQASKQSNEKEVFSHRQDKREKQTPKIKLGQLVRTADIKRVFGKGDSTNWSYNQYCKDVHKFSELINLSINIFELNFHQKQNNWRHKIVPIEVSKNDSDRVIDLAIYRDHFILIKDLIVFLGGLS